jgi:tetratricopeptide (TPR) repeat protein
VTLDHDEAALDDPSAHAADIAVVIATVLARVGQSNLAAQVAAATAGSSRVILDFEVAFTLVGAMTRSHRVMEALHLSDALDERGQVDGPEEDARIAASIIQTAVLAHDDALSVEERRLAVEVAERTLRRAEERGDRAAARAASYNLAMLHKSGRDAEPAIAAFRRAAEIDATYLERPYFHSDFAGVLFESGYFAEAAEHYGQALAGGEEGLGRALYADALLFSGRYAEAQQQLDRYVEADLGPPGAEWRLKQRVLPRIRSTGGETQERAPEDAETLAERVDFTGARGDLSVEEAEQLIASALELDACCAEAWFRRALLELGANGDPGTALESAIISAVLHRYAIGAWRNAVRLAQEAGQPEDLVADLLRTGYRFNGEDFVRELTDAVSQGDESADMLPILDVAMNEVDEATRRAGFVMRIPDAGGEMTEFAFEPEP